MSGEHAIRLAVYVWGAVLLVGSVGFLVWAVRALRVLRRHEREREAEEHAERRRELVSSARYPREPR